MGVEKAVKGGREEGRSGEKSKVNGKKRRKKGTSTDIANDRAILQGGGSERPMPLCLRLDDSGMNGTRGRKANGTPYRVCRVS
jgi:hypothetical protein